MSQANSHEDRRRFLQLAAAAAVSQIPLPKFIRPAFAEALKQDASASLLAIPLDVTAAIAGGSPNEFEGLRGGFSQGKGLSDFEQSIYEAYAYAAKKAPATEDPRQSLRGLFASRVSDATFQFAKKAGANPKIYDARGDGLTNGGKGGVIKGLRGLLDTLKGQGALADFTLDSSAHDEVKWQQGNPSSLTLTIKAPAGLAAARRLAEDGVGLQLSLAGSAAQGYLKQCKVTSAVGQALADDSEVLTLKLNWAGKARQQGTLDRRSADKLNAARAYRE